MFVPAFVGTFLISLLYSVLTSPFEELPAFGAFCVLLGLLLIHVLAVWYRLSIKLTAFVWLPLLYVAVDIVPRGWSVSRRLETICASATAWIARSYALVVIVLLATKFIGQIVYYKTVRALLEQHDWLLVISPLVEPIKVPFWQVLGLLNAFLVWGLYIFADRQLRKHEHQEGLSDQSVSNLLSGTRIIMWVITAYTGYCTIYAIYIIIKNSHPQEWELKFFPWQ